MISFNLACDQGHGFQAWFKSQSDYEAQSERGLVTCPVCDSTRVSKTLMAPGVATGRARDAARAEKGREIRRAMRELHDHITRNADDVGDRFASEARSMHLGETDARAIYGRASKEEVEALIEDEVPIAPLPPRPDDAN